MNEPIGSAVFLGEHDQFPDGTPLALKVFGGDCDEYSFVREDGADLILTQKVLVDNQVQTLVIPVSFPSIEKAQRAGRIIDLALDEAKKISEERLPDRCEHKLRAIRFSRTFKQDVVCEICASHWTPGK